MELSTEYKELVKKTIKSWPSDKHHHYTDELQKETEGYIAKLLSEDKSFDDRPKDKNLWIQGHVIDFIKSKVDNG